MVYYAIIIIMTNSQMMNSLINLLLPWLNQAIHIFLIQFQGTIGTPLINLTETDVNTIV